MIAAADKLTRGPLGLLATEELCTFNCKADESAGINVTRYYELDHLGTIRAISDSLGHLVSTSDYEPFGLELKSASFSWWTDSSSNTHKFTGHERDEEAGEDYMKARMYVLSTARFPQIDPVFGGAGDPQNWNPYIYVGNSPVGSSDPAGTIHINISGVALSSGCDGSACGGNPDGDDCVVCGTYIWPSFSFASTYTGLGSSSRSGYNSRNFQNGCAAAVNGVCISSSAPNMAISNYYYYLRQDTMTRMALYNSTQQAAMLVRMQIRDSIEDWITYGWTALYFIQESNPFDSESTFSDQAQAMGQSISGMTNYVTHPSSRKSSYDAILSASSNTALGLTENNPTAHRAVVGALSISTMAATAAGGLIVADAAGVSNIGRTTIGLRGGEIIFTRPGKTSPDLRINPFGDSRSNKPGGRRPHYHRRPGINKHRPWE